LSLIVVSSFNESIDSTIEFIFAAEACTSNLTSTECTKTIESTLTTVLFEGMRAPVHASLGKNHAAQVGLAVLKLKAQQFIVPHLNLIAEPLSKEIHQEVSKANPNPNLSTADASIAASKLAISIVKNDILRNAQGFSAPVCEAIEIPIPDRMGRYSVSASAAIRHGSFCLLVPAIALVYARA